MMSQFMRILIWFMVLTFIIVHRILLKRSIGVFTADLPLLLVTNLLPHFLNDLLLLSLVRGGAGDVELLHDGLAGPGGHAGLPQATVPIYGQGEEGQDLNFWFYFGL